MATFKDRLEEALTMRKITPAELSKLTGIGEGAISQYRKGAYKASQRNLEKIATALHVSIPWLMGATDDPTVAIKNDSATGEFSLPISPEDANLLYAYHRASPEDRAIIDNIIARYIPSEAKGKNAG